MFYVASKMMFTNFRKCILACNSISLIPFNSLESQLLFDVLCFNMDQVVMELSTRTLTSG